MPSPPAVAATAAAEGGVAVSAVSQPSDRRGGRAPASALDRADVLASDDVSERRVPPGVEVKFVCAGNVTSGSLRRSLSSGVFVAVVVASDSRMGEIERYGIPN